MMPEEMLTAFRAFAPEFSETSDEMIQARIDFVCDFISKKKFGRFYDNALLCLVAHYLTLQQTVADEGAASATLTAGAVVTEKEGDLERRYADGSGGAASSTDPDVLYKKTAYGLMFLQLRAMVIVPALTRMG